MKNLQLLQNKAAKTIVDRPFHSSATSEKRRLFHRCLYVYKWVNEVSAHSIDLLALGYRTRLRYTTRSHNVTRDVMAFGREFSSSSLAVVLLSCSCFGMNFSVFKYRKAVPSLICATQESTTSRRVLISMSYRQYVHEFAIFAKCKRRAFLLLEYDGILILFPPLTYPTNNMWRY